MLTINRHETLPKSFYYLGAAIIVLSIALLAIRLQPLLDFGLFKPSGQLNSGKTATKTSSDNTDSTASNSSDQSNSNAPDVGGSGGNGTTPLAKQTGISSGTTPVSIPGAVGSLPSTGGGGSGGSTPPTNGEPDGDEFPTLTLPPINVSPSVQVGNPLH